MNRYYYEYQKRQEEERKKEIETLFEKWEQEERIKRIAKEAAEDASKRYLEAHGREIEISVDKRSLAAVEDALKSIF